MVNIEEHFLNWDLLFRITQIRQTSSAWYLWCHCAPAFDCGTVSGCEQLVVGPAHARGGTLDLMTDVPELVRVAVVAPIGNSDHSSLSAVVLMAQAVANFSWNIKSTGIQSVVQYRICPGVTFGFADNPFEVSNEHLSLLVGRYVPTKVIRVRHKKKPWFHVQCGHVFDLKQKAHLRWNRDRSRVNWEEFVLCQVGGQASV